MFLPRPSGWSATAAECNCWFCAAQQHLDRVPVVELKGGSEVGLLVKVVDVACAVRVVLVLPELLVVAWTLALVLHRAKLTLQQRCRCRLEVTSCVTQ